MISALKFEYREIDVLLSLQMVQLKDTSTCTCIYDMLVNGSQQKSRMFLAIALDVHVHVDSKHISKPMHALYALLGIKEKKSKGVSLICAESFQPQYTCTYVALLLHTCNTICGISKHLQVPK